MLKNYLREINKSIYALAKDSGVPYSTLNDLVNNKVSIDNCKVSLLRSLSGSLGLTMDELYGMLSLPEHTVVNSYDVALTLNVRNKTYYVLFEYQGSPVELELCKVNDDTTYYIDEIMKWRSEGYIRRRRMSEFR